MSVHDHKAKTIDGREVSLADYKGKVLLIVNTASKCGLTPQYEGLEALYRKHKDEGFEVLGFPSNQYMGQEPGTDEQIATFCSTKYDVTFPMFSKVDVKGKDAHPLWKEITGGEAPAWNFSKYLIGRDGEVIERIGPRTPPKDVEPAVARALAS